MCCAVACGSAYTLFRHTCGSERFLGFSHGCCIFTHGLEAQCVCVSHSDPIPRPSMWPNTVCGGRYEMIF